MEDNLENELEKELNGRPSSQDEIAQLLNEIISPEESTGDQYTNQIPKEKQNVFRGQTQKQRTDKLFSDFYKNTNSSPVIKKEEIEKGNRKIYTLAEYAEMKRRKKRINSS